MLRTVCDLQEACPGGDDDQAAGAGGSAADSVFLSRASPEAKEILRYLGRCVGAPSCQRASAFQNWMQKNQDWVRGRRFLGIPDVCLPQPEPPYIDFNQELAAASPALYDMYCADLLRLLSYGSAVTTDPDPYLDLYRWTDPATVTAWYPAREQSRASTAGPADNTAGPSCASTAGQRTDRPQSQPQQQQQQQQPYVHVSAQSIPGGTAAGPAAAGPLRAAVVATTVGPAGEATPAAGAAGGATATAGAGAAGAVGTMLTGTAAAAGARDDEDVVLETPPRGPGERPAAARGSPGEEAASQQDAAAGQSAAQAQGEGQQRAVIGSGLGQGQSGQQRPAAATAAPPACGPAALGPAGAAAAAASSPPAPPTAPLAPRCRPQEDFEDDFGENGFDGEEATEDDDYQGDKDLSSPGATAAASWFPFDPQLCPARTPSAAAAAGAGASTSSAAATPEPASLVFKARRSRFRAWIGGGGKRVEEEPGADGGLPVGTADGDGSGNSTGSGGGGNSTGGGGGGGSEGGSRVGGTGLDAAPLDLALEGQASAGGAASEAPSGATSSTAAAAAVNDDGSGTGGRGGPPLHAPSAQPASTSVPGPALPPGMSSADPASLPPSLATPTAAPVAATPSHLYAPAAHVDPTPAASSSQAGMPEPRQASSPSPSASAVPPAAAPVTPAMPHHSTSTVSLHTLSAATATAPAESQSAPAAAAVPALPPPVPDAPPPQAPPFGSSGPAAAARLCRSVPGFGAIPERLFLKAPGEALRLRGLPHGTLPIDWRSRLPDVLQVAHPALPWFSPARGGGLVLAGGAALAMAVPGASASDADIFLVVPSVDPATRLRRTPAERRNAAWVLVRETLEALRRQVAVYDRTLKLYVTAGAKLHTLDVLVLDTELSDLTGGRNLVAQVQLVLRLYESPAQVIHGFDVDVCGVLYDGSEVWATARALRALHCGFLMVEPVRQSPSYELRLNKYSRRLGLDLLVPGLDPLLVEPAVQELEAMQSELASRLVARQAAFWVTTPQDRERVAAAFHRDSRVPTVRRHAAKQTGLARLLLIQRLAAMGVTAEEARLAATGYKVHGGTSADAAVERAIAYHNCFIYVHEPCVACMFLGTSLAGEDETWGKLRAHVEFQVDDVHLQTGREALFSGSFTHTPFNDWYRCCLSKLEERLLRGEVDWEARARERVITERNAGLALSAADLEAQLESKARLYASLLAAMRAGRPAAGAASASGGTVGAAGAAGAGAGGQTTTQHLNDIHVARALQALEPLLTLGPAPGQGPGMAVAQGQGAVVGPGAPLVLFPGSPPQPMYAGTGAGDAAAGAAGAAVPTAGGDGSRGAYPAAAASSLEGLLPGLEAAAADALASSDPARADEVLAWATAAALDGAALPLAGLEPLTQGTALAAAAVPAYPGSELISWDAMTESLAAGALAGAPGLAPGLPYSATTGELLYLGRRYRLVDAEAGEAPGSAPKAAPAAAAAAAAGPLERSSPAKQGTQQGARQDVVAPGGTPDAKTPYAGTSSCSTQSKNMSVSVSEPVSAMAVAPVGPASQPVLHTSHIGAGAAGPGAGVSGREVPGYVKESPSPSLPAGERGSGRSAAAAASGGPGQAPAGRLQHGPLSDADADRSGVATPAPSSGSGLPPGVATATDVTGAVAMAVGGWLLSTAAPAAAALLTAGACAARRDLAEWSRAAAAAAAASGPSQWRAVAVVLAVEAGLAALLALWMGPWLRG